MSIWISVFIFVSISGSEIEKYEIWDKMKDHSYPSVSDLVWFLPLVMHTIALASLKDTASMT